MKHLGENGPKEIFFPSLNKAERFPELLKAKGLAKLTIKIDSQPRSSNWSSGSNIGIDGDTQV